MRFTPFSPPCALSLLLVLVSGVARAEDRLDRAIDGLIEAQRKSAEAGREADRVRETALRAKNRVEWLESEQKKLAEAVSAAERAHRELEDAEKTQRAKGSLEDQRSRMDSDRTVLLARYENASPAEKRKILAILKSQASPEIDPLPEMEEKREKSATDLAKLREELARLEISLAAAREALAERERELAAALERQEAARRDLERAQGEYKSALEWSRSLKGRIERGLRYAKDIAVGTARELGKQVIGATDDLTRKAVDALIPNSKFPNGLSSVALATKGELEIPLGELGIPATGYLAGADRVKVTRRPDGKYWVTIEGTGKLGLSEPLVKAKGDVRIGSKKFGIGADVGMKGGFEGRTRQILEFDPSKNGDMTKMAALLAALGSAKLPMSIPGADKLAVAALSENLVATRVEGGLFAQAKGNVALVIPVLGGRVDASVLAGIESRIDSDDGSRVLVPSLRAEARGELWVPGYSGSAKIDAAVKPIIDPDTGRVKRINLVLDVATGGEKGLGEEFKKALESRFKKVIPGASLRDRDSTRYILTVENPDQALTQLVTGLAQGTTPAPAVLAQIWAQSGRLRVMETNKDAFGLGASAGLGALTQGAKIAFDVEGSVSDTGVTYDSKSTGNASLQDMPDLLDGDDHSDSD